MSIEAMKMALNALENGGLLRQKQAITALRQAIEQAEKQTSAAQFWQGVYPDGWTAERVEAEMTDYYNLLDGMDSLIDYVTGGAISKPLTDKSVIRMKHDEHVNKMIEEAMQEATLQEMSDIRQEIEQEPVAWMTNSEQDVTAEFLFSHVQTQMHKIPLYEAPLKREWVGLTVRDYHEVLNLGGFDAFKAIEAKLREKNT
jgi:hypothetical protein